MMIPISRNGQCKFSGLNYCYLHSASKSTITWLFIPAITCYRDTQDSCLSRVASNCLSRVSLTYRIQTKPTINKSENIKKKIRRRNKKPRVTTTDHNGTRAMTVRMSLG